MSDILINLERIEISDDEDELEDPTATHHRVEKVNEISSRSSEVDSTATETDSTLPLNISDNTATGDMGQVSPQEIDDFDFLGTLDDGYLLSLFTNKVDNVSSNVSAPTKISLAEDSSVCDTLGTSDHAGTNSNDTANNRPATDVILSRNDSDSNTRTTVAPEIGNVPAESENTDSAGKKANTTLHSNKATRSNPPRSAKIGVSYKEEDHDQEKYEGYCMFNFTAFL